LLKKQEIQYSYQDVKSVSFKRKGHLGHRGGSGGEGGEVACTALSVWRRK